MRSYVRLWFWCVVILAETFCGSATNFHALAQSGGATTGEVTGVVIDVQGGGVAGVVVIAQRVETGLIRQAQTDASGQFRLPQLPPGLYQLTVEAAGFRKQTSEVTVSIGISEPVEFQLSIEGTQEVMEVTASDDEFRKNQVRRKTESSTIINQLLINNLPINQRDFLDFSRTSARVTEDRIPSQGVSSTSKLSFNGQASRFNNINVDGLDNNDAGVGAGRSTFSQESVREFQIISDSLVELSILSRGAGAMPFTAQCLGFSVTKPSVPVMPSRRLIRHLNKPSLAPLSEVRSNVTKPFSLLRLSGEVSARATLSRLRMRRLPPSNARDFRFEMAPFRFRWAIARCWGG